MDLSKDLVSKLVKATSPKPETNNESTHNATTVVYDGETYVRIDGSDRLTPVLSTTETSDNERVIVSIKDHQATIIGNVTNPSASVSTTDTISDSVTALGTVVASKASIESLSAETARINTLVADNTVINGKLDAHAADITELEADNATIHQTLAAKQADIERLFAEKADITVLEADYATIESLDVTNENVYNLEATYLTAQAENVRKLNAHDASITSLTANKANVSDLNAAVADIENLEATKADIEDLEANYAEIDLANVNNAWIQNGVIKNGSISDAQILGVSANKLTAGTIDASNITVTNLNASNITTGTINGQRIGTGSLDLSKLATEVTTKSDFDEAVERLDERIDGAIETWTSTVVPTLNNYPASSWTSYDAKKSHVGDVLYVINPQSEADGHSYRFAEGSNQSFSWVLIKDSDVTKALQEIVSIKGDISDLETFESETSSWISNTDDELNSIKSRQTTVETTLGTKVDTSTFNELSQTVDENTASITSLSQTVSTKADSSTVTALSNTVNTVSQKADTNTASITSLSQTVSTKADQSTVTSLSNTVNTVSQKADSNQLAISRTKQEIISLGEQLVINGNGILGDNTNFSGLIFDGSETVNGSAGSFTELSNTVKTILSDDMFPVTSTIKYALDFDAKTKNGLSTMYSMLMFYDVDKRQIVAYMHMYVEGSLTTLSQELKNGDTVVHFSSLSGWKIPSPNNQYSRGFIFWNYVNSYGYAYPELTYSRNVWYGLYSDDNMVDKTNNTITLTSPWNHGTIPSGTKVSQSNHGNVYKYQGAVGGVVPTSWTHYHGYYDGVDYSGKNITYKMPPGSAYAGFGFLWNHNSKTDQTWATNISIKTDYQGEINTLSNDISTVSQTLSGFQTTVANTYSTKTELQTLSNDVSTSTISDNTEAYSKQVPATARKWASVDRMQGNTQVWNQRISSNRQVGANGYSTISTDADGVTTVTVLQAGATYRQGMYAGLASNPDVNSASVLFMADVYCPRLKGFVMRKTRVDTSTIATIDTFECAAGVWYTTMAILPAEEVESTGGVKSSLRIHPIGQDLEAGETFKVRNPYMVNLTQMFGAGNEPTTTSDPRIQLIREYAIAHPEYNEGELISAAVDDVVSRGKNLLANIKDKTYTSNGVTFKKNDDGSVTIDGTASANVYYNLDYGSNESNAVTDATVLIGKTLTCSLGVQNVPSGVLLYIGSFPSTSNDTCYPAHANLAPTGAIRAGATKLRSYIRIDSGTAVSNLTVYPQLELGSTATPYSPYGTIDTLTIPQNVRDLCPNYGASAGSVRNELDLVNKRYIQRVGAVDMGTLTWVRSSTNTSGKYRMAPSPQLQNAKATAANSDVANLVCPLYEAIRSDGSGTYGCIEGASIDTQSCFYVYDPDYSSSTSAESFKAAMQGVMLCYELATPVTVDLSGVLHDRFLQCEAGGSLTFEQVGDTEVPLLSDVTYYLGDSGTAYAEGMNAYGETNGAQEDLVQAKNDIQTINSNVSQLTQQSDSFQAEVASSFVDVNNDISTAKSSITQLSNSLSSLIVDKNGRSLMVQTAGGWQWSTESIDDTLKSIPNQFESVSDDIQNLNTTLSREISEVKTTADNVSSNVSRYMEFGNDGLILRKDNSPLNLNLTESQISFNKSGNQVAYIDGDTETLYIRNEQILKNLRFGNFVFFEREGSNYKGDGSHNMGLKWIT